MKSWLTKGAKGKAFFDELAKNYDEQIPKHIREHLCIKKVDFMVKYLTYIYSSNYTKLKGLDVGCGTGWHIKRFREKGFDVQGIDVSYEMIKQAGKNNNEQCFVVGSSDKLSFKDGTYDFVYFINLLHHLETLEEQKNSLEEAYNLLKIGGVIFIQEVNEDFFLFKIYMKYIFPHMSKIHNCEREENYLSIKQILDIVKDKLLLHDVMYFTFLPNIIPRFAFPPLKRIEAFLEKRTKNKFGAHWLMVLKKVK